MRPAPRLFEIIQLLRATDAPQTADHLAEKLEVSVHTIYRDIAALQAMGTPVEGAAGIGYVMRRGYDLPPLNFDQEEVEALRVGLSMLARTGDGALHKAAFRICQKIDALHGPADWLRVATEGAPADDPEKGCVSVADLRAAIREERKLQITYRDPVDVETKRIIRPIVMIYYHDSRVLVAWCELRAAFRHFRTDRIWACALLDETFEGQGGVLRQLWEESDCPKVPIPPVL